MQSISWEIPLAELVNNKRHLTGRVAKPDMNPRVVLADQLVVHDSAVPYDAHKLRRRAIGDTSEVGAVASWMVLCVKVIAPCIVVWSYVALAAPRLECLIADFALQFLATVSAGYTDDVVVQQRPNQLQPVRRAL